MVHFAARMFKQSGFLISHVEDESSVGVENVPPFMFGSHKVIGKYLGFRRGLLLERRGWVIARLLLRGRCVGIRVIPVGFAVRLVMVLIVDWGW